MIRLLHILQMELQMTLHFKYLINKAYYTCYSKSRASRVSALTIHMCALARACARVRMCIITCSMCSKLY